MNTPYMRCTVPGCGRSLPGAHVMCREHWKLLPYPRRAEVMTACKRHRDGELSLRDLWEVLDPAVRLAAERAAERGAA